MNADAINAASIPVYRRANPDHAKLPGVFWKSNVFVRVTAAGSGDSIFVNSAEVLAIEVNSETSRVQFVMKTGGALPINEDIETVIDRLTENE
jgi:hypothetical protein